MASYTFSESEKRLLNRMAYKLTEMNEQLNPIAEAPWNALRESPMLIDKDEVVAINDLMNNVSGCIADATVYIHDLLETYGKEN